MNPQTTYDIVTIGETMLRLTADRMARLEDASTLQVHVGGSESNTAVGLSRLDRRVTWLSRLPANALGFMIERTLRGHAVDTSHVVWAPSDRLGIHYFEEGSPPRPSQVIYDRTDSAFAKFQAHELPEAIFQPGGARWLHVTGISLAVSPTARGLIARAIQLATAVGWKISFDVNYRGLLWTTEEARAACEPYVAAADLVFLPARDARALWNLPADLSNEQVLTRMLAIRDGQPTILTLGPQGAIAGTGERICYAPCTPVPPIGRLGGGDAFTAGFLDAWLDNRGLEDALRWAVATARLKYSIPGDLPLITRREVQAVCDTVDATLRR